MRKQQRRAPPSGQIHLLEIVCNFKVHGNTKNKITVLRITIATSYRDCQGFTSLAWEPKAKTL